MRKTRGKRAKASTGASEAGPQRPAVRAKFQLSFGPRTLFGDGKARLLEEVDRLGSLRAAAASMDMSYRHAWGLLRELEQAAGIALLEHAAPGPRSRLRLTPEGRRLLAAWHAFRDPLDELVSRHFRRHFGARRRS